MACCFLALFLIPWECSQSQDKYTPHPRMLQGNVKLDAFGLKLLENKSVQSYIGLGKTDEEWVNQVFEHHQKQLSDIDSLKNKTPSDINTLMRANTRAKNVHDSLLRDVGIFLNSEHLVKLHQIRMQLIGVSICFSPELVSIMQVTPQQQLEYSKATAQYEKELEDAIRTKAVTLTKSEKIERLTQAHNKTFPVYQEKVKNTLSAQQQEWFVIMQGTPIKLEKEKFNPEFTLLRIEQRLIPRAIPRIIEPFPLAEIALIKQVLNWAKVSAEHQPQVQRLATNWIEAELSFYKQLETTSEAQREDVLKKWYFKRVQDHAQFTDEIRKLCGKDVVHRLNQAQMQLRGFTILAEKSLREKLGISDDQFRAMMATLSVPAASPPKPDPKAPRLAYGRISYEMEQKMMEVLAPEQIKRWRDLVGDPIAPDDLKAIAEQVMQTQSSRLPESAFFDPNRNKAK